MKGDVLDEQASEDRGSPLVRAIGWVLVGAGALLVTPAVLWCAFASAGLKGSPDRTWVELFRGNDLLLATWPVYPTALIGLTGLGCLLIGRPFARPGTPKLAFVFAVAILVVSGVAALLTTLVFRDAGAESPPFTTSPLSAAFLLPQGYCVASSVLLGWLVLRAWLARRANP